MKRFDNLAKVSLALNAALVGIFAYLACVSASTSLLSASIFFLVAALNGLHLFREARDLRRMARS